MLSGRQISDMLLERDTEKRNKMIDALTEEEAKDVLKRFSSVMWGEYREKGFSVK